MKKIFCILFLSFVAFSIKAQVSKVIEVFTPGTLTTLLTTTEKTTITVLTIIGKIDASDVKCIRNEISNLVVLDLSKTNIEAYSGTGGTYNSIDYPANELPIYSFYNKFTGIAMQNLKTINLPNSLTSIGDGAFQQCQNLTNIVIPDSVKLIGIGAFDHCYGLSNINIPNKVTSIGKGAFNYCGGLTSVLIGNCVTSIGVGAFAICDKLATINIPISVSSIGASAFASCSSLTSITIPNLVQSIENSTFYGCIGLTFVKIPSSVTTIGASAFAYCGKLTSVSIPNSVISIGTNAFISCNSLNSIYTYSELPINLNQSVFKNVDPTTCILYVPINSKSAYQLANQWKDFINIVEMTTALPTTINENIQIYQNPVSNNFSVSGFVGFGSLILTDVNGRIILSQKISASDVISTNGLSKGLYIAKIHSNCGNKTCKIVKK